MDKIIEINPQNYNQFDKHVPHIVQTTYWGEFRKSLGNTVYYFGQIQKSELVKGWMMYITTIPYLNRKIGVITQCHEPTKELIDSVNEVAKKEKLISVKFEPLIQDSNEAMTSLTSLGLTHGEDLFLRHTFILDLHAFTIDDIFKQFSTSTRRNIRIAQKKDLLVEIHPYSKDSYDAIDTYYALSLETTKRHRFATHSLGYFHTLYDQMKNHLIVFTAKLNDEPIAALVMMTDENRAYYPYGASAHKYIETKAPNLLVYQAIQYAYNAKYDSFNFWGALEENPDPDQPLYGVHNFKKGFNGKHISYVGGYDLVIEGKMYRLFNKAFSLYWKVRKGLRKLKI